jgi:hypothetical protein
MLSVAAAETALDERMDGVTDKPEASADNPPKKQPTTSLAVSYFIARFGIFVVILAIFWLVGFRGLPGALAAAILSIPVSFFGLTKMRVRVAEAMAERKQTQTSLRDEFRTGGRDGK